MRRIGSLLTGVVVWTGLALGQVGIGAPTLLRSGQILPPAIDSAGRRVAFGSATAPDGTVGAAADAYIAGVDGSGLRRLTDSAKGPGDGVNALSLSPDGSRLAYTVQTLTEQVHMVDTATASDRTVAVDQEGCVQILALCIGCVSYCVNTPHVTSDGAKVLYSVRRDQPFRTVNADGTGGTSLPVFSGGLAAAAQRVISTNGTVVFTSAAPSGPTFAASATDVYTIGLNGAGLRNVTNFGLKPPLFANNAVISAAGDVVAFESNADGSGEVQIWTARADGTGLRRLSAGDGAATGPSISADGSIVAFAQDGQIWVARTGGAAAALQLTSFRSSVAQDPAISDDGTRIAFSVGPRAGQRGAIYSIASAGGDPRPVFAPRSMSRDGVSAASPGALMVVYGLNLALDGITTAGRLPLPDSLGGVSLLVNGQPAPISVVTPWQVNAQLPPQTPLGPATLQFRFANGDTTPPATVEVKSASPELFSYLAEGAQPGTVYDQAAAFHAGSAIPADVKHPAQAGETLETYGTGLGATAPAVPAGTAAPGSPPAQTILTPQVRIGAMPAQVTFSGLVPGTVGIYQVNVIVPPGVAAGLEPLSWQVGPAELSSSTIAVR